MFKSGKLVSKHVTEIDGSTVPDRQIQPHGVELTVDKIFRCNNYTVLGDEDYEKASRQEATTVGPGKFLDKSDSKNHNLGVIKPVDSSNEEEDDIISIDKSYYALIDGPYVVRYNEKIRVPDGCVGFVWPRSRLIRSGNHLSSAVWDSGYEGRGEGGLHINCTTFVEESMRLGQFVLAEADVAEQYDGSHQGENIDQ